MNGYKHQDGAILISRRYRREMSYHSGAAWIEKNNEH